MCRITHMCWIPGHKDNERRVLGSQSNSLNKPAKIRVTHKDRHIGKSWMSEHIHVTKNSNQDTEPHQQPRSSFWPPPLPKDTNVFAKFLSSSSLKAGSKGLKLKTETFVRGKQQWWLLFSCSVASDSLPPHGLQHTRLPSPSLSLRVCSSSCPLNQWCHPTISSTVVDSCEEGEPPLFWGHHRSPCFLLNLNDLLSSLLPLPNT